MHHIALILDVAKWKPPKPGCLGFDAQIYALHTGLDESNASPTFEIKICGRVHLTGNAHPQAQPYRKLVLPILIGRFDSFAPKIMSSGKLFLHMDAMFEELPTDGELEAQGFVRDHPRETHYGA